jgi:hypothetical protein
MSKIETQAISSLNISENNKTFYFEYELNFF